MIKRLIMFGFVPCRINKPLIDGRARQAGRVDTPHAAMGSVTEGLDRH